MKVYDYIVTVKHDKGIAKIRTSGTSKKQVIEMIMQDQLCPRRAIKKVERAK